MGGNKGWQSKKWAASYSGQRAYSYNWDPEQNWDREWSSSKPNKAFPSYDQVAVTEERKTGDKRARGQEDEQHGGDFVKDIQKLLNLARRAQGRVRRAQAEKKSAAGKWTEWQNQMKAAFKKESMKYHADQRRIQEEIDEQLEVHNQAMADLQDFLENPFEGRKIKEELKDDADIEAAWRQLTESQDDESEIAELLAASKAKPLGEEARKRLKNYVKAMAAEMRSSASKRRAPTSEDSLHDIKEEGTDVDMPHPPPPYLLSPSTRTTRTSPLVVRGPKIRGSSRMPIKPAIRARTPTPKPGTTLSAKLEARRQRVTIDLQDSEDDHIGDLAGPEKPEGPPIEPTAEE